MASGSAARERRWAGLAFSCRHSRAGAVSIAVSSEAVALAAAVAVGTNTLRGTAGSVCEQTVCSNSRPLRVTACAVVNASSDVILERHNAVTDGVQEQKAAASKK